eukprot:GHVU01054831.1.p1 GENE.GHVU01054831.1~~GHVU01054831.1.p1  ORF type:complete len:109 (+),score=17.42 GHVU01054831.1:811-1137(+)
MSTPQLTPDERLELLAQLIIASARQPQDVYETEHRPEIQGLLWQIDGRLALERDGEATESFLDGLYQRHIEEFGSPPYSEDELVDAVPVFYESDESSTRDTDEVSMEE